MTHTKGLAVGRTVHFVLPNGDHRPAVVVRVWGQDAGYARGTINLQVFTDGLNDRDEQGKPMENVVWRTSVHYNEDVPALGGTWHWPEYVDEGA